jgi:mycothiol synthase
VTDLGWHSSLASGDQVQVREVILAAACADGIAPVGEQVLRALPSQGTKHLAAMDGKRVVGYLNLAPSTDAAPPVAEAVVAPDARRRGVGTSMVKAAIKVGGDTTRFWAHGNLDSARSIAASLGLKPVRELWQMRRSLRDLPPVTVPGGVRLRTYRGTEDDAELLRVNNAAFSWHPEQGGWTPDDIAARRCAPWFDPDGFFLAFDEDTHKLTGFHWTKVHVEDSGLGEVYVLGVDPAEHGRGLGSVLTLVGLHHLAERLSHAADPTVMLYTEADNAAAVRIYQRLGFEVCGTDTAYAAT